VNDRAIQTVKQTLFKEMGKSGTTKWVDKLPKSVESHNKTPHSSLLNEAPEDVEKTPVVQFRLQEENAEKMMGNADQLKKRQNALQSAGAFRTMLPKQSFARGFQAKWSNDVHTVASISQGYVTDTAGKRVQISKVLPVPAGSQKANVPKALAAGSQARSAKQAEELARYKGPLRQFLGEGAKGMAVVGTFLRGQPGFEERLKELRLDRPGGIRLAVQAMGSSFQVSGEGQKGQPTVKARPATRLRGKQ
jgi:hypothetical protein